VISSLYNIFIFWIAMSNESNDVFKMYLFRCRTPPILAILHRKRHEKNQRLVHANVQIKTCSCWSKVNSRVCYFWDLNEETNHDFLKIPMPPLDLQKSILATKNTNVKQAIHSQITTTCIDWFWRCSLWKHSLDELTFMLLRYLNFTQKLKIKIVMHRKQL